VKPCCDIHGRKRGCTFCIYPSEDRKQSMALVFPSNQHPLSGGFEVQERDEAKIMRGVAEITHKEVVDVMKPLDLVDMLEMSECLDKAKLISIDSRGHSRLPVYDTNKHNIRAFILVKNLIVYDPDDNRPLREMIPLMMKPVLVKPGMKLLDLLNKFQEHRTHFAVVTNAPELVQKAWETDSGETIGDAIPPNVHMAGIITLEDVIEQLLLEDIDDEADPGKIKRTSFWDRPKTNSMKEMSSPFTSQKESPFAEGWASPTHSWSAPADLDRPLLEDKAPGEAAGSQESGCRIA